MAFVIRKSWIVYRPLVVRQVMIHKNVFFFEEIHNFWIVNKELDRAILFKRIENCWGGIMKTEFDVKITVKLWLQKIKRNEWQTQFKWLLRMHWTMSTVKIYISKANELFYYDFNLFSAVKISLMWRPVIKNRCALNVFSVHFMTCILFEKYLQCMNRDKNENG